MPTCTITGRSFEVSAKEMELRKKMGIDGEPSILPAFRFLQLGAFWQHWNLHRRSCDLTMKPIISVFGSECPYPVWHKEEWVKQANPPGADFDPSRSVFEQMWKFFQKSPIPHNIGAGSQNCEYTDDWWYGKNCYLCHSGFECEDVRYLYRVIKGRDSWFSVFSGNIELCTDVINSLDCFNAVFVLNSKQCRDSAFLYDCKNCSDSLFCWNLSNKQYCFMNEQLTKEEFEVKREEWDLGSREVYELAKTEFQKILREKAWHRSLQNFFCEQVSGDYLVNCHDMENCYFMTNECQDCVNAVRAGMVKDCLDTFCAMTSELVYYGSSVQDQCYDVKFGYNLIQCKFAEYSAFCFQSEHLFGCCGLVGKKYYIFNKPYSPEEYEAKKAEIIAEMKRTGEYGKFFPGYFAANPYEESISGYFFPLEREQAKGYGFRVRDVKEERVRDALDPSEIPDRAEEADESLSEKTFWDPVAKRPFQILKQDIALAKKLGVPLPNSFYITRLQENYRYLPFKGAMRTTVCVRCLQSVQASHPAEYDGRILCEECYRKEVVG